MTNLRRKTFGERRVRVNFNPGRSSDVDVVKQEVALLIDDADKLVRNSTPDLPGETRRLLALGHTAAE